ncbi:MAG TPA: 23S rRNA (guanosine(2251)-2'-O)-methyltransferase RlmB [Methylocystis sp.]|nr:23S rRNA (guanosine(2251)-2'-O)-methyltransferase RlmB [Methylocystis sp.]
MSERNRGRGSAAQDISLIYGAHAVREALAARRRKFVALHATVNALPRVAELAAAVGLKPRVVDARELTRRLGPDAVHQGLLLEAKPPQSRELEDVAPGGGLLLALDQITDPHNVGAILRTAAAFGVRALIVTERHSPEFGAVVAKAACGGLEHVEIVSVVNLARALDLLREHGFQTVGLDSEGAERLETIPLQASVALVLGAEDKGLRRLTRERCDTVARLDVPGAIKSLNVSNACAVALSVLRRRLG